MDKYSVWQFYPDAVENWAYMEGVLTAQECAQVIEVGEKKGLERARTYDKDANAARDSDVCFLMPSDVEFVYRKITDVVLHLNENFFKFDLFGLGEGLQFTRYVAPSGHYKRHLDKTTNSTVRKLSLTIQLSDPQNYEGGDLLLHLADEPDKPSKKQGNMVVFPSYVLHEVTPVTEGRRYSLVAWVTGKPFK